MAISWRPPEKRAKVQRILKKHHARSNMCDRAAKSIWPLAKEQDEDAAYWLLMPGPYGGPYVLPDPKVVPNPPSWFFHVCVATEMHTVCALTGPDGVASKGYVEQKFQYSDTIRTMEITSTVELEVEIDKILAA
jgi:hypothetical protein